MGRAKWHVTPTGDGDWKVKREGADRADSIHEDKADAVERARELGRGNTPAQIIIHGRDGKIREERTYERDPFPPEG